MNQEYDSETFFFFTRVVGKEKKINIDVWNERQVDEHGIFKPTALTWLPEKRLTSFSWSLLKLGKLSEKCKESPQELKWNPESENWFLLIPRPSRPELPGPSSSKLSFLISEICIGNIPNDEKLNWPSQLFVELSPLNPLPTL